MTPTPATGPGPLLCGTILEPDTDAALEQAEAVADRADLFEFRLDAMSSPDPASLVAGSPRPAILTCRSVADRGRFAGPERDRLALLRRAIDAGAAYVDVEVGAARALGDRGDTRLVVSWHDFEGTPDDLAAVLARIEEHGPDVAKLVPTARNAGDVLRLLALLRSSTRPLAAHPMGRAGFPGRILAARAGSAILYGAARSAAAAAPGQPSLGRLVEDYRLDRDLRRAETILLFGARLDHSVSPRILNRCFADAGEDALYVPFETSDPDEALRVLDGTGSAGGAVTIPLKEGVAARLGDLEASARETGAVNTVHGPRGRRIGANTDRDGALDAIRAVAESLAGRRALVLGAGGAARAIVSGLVTAGARVIVVNRTRARARRLAEATGAEERTLGEVEPEGIDLVVNATPVGQWPDVDATPLPPAFLRSRMIVMDAVYNPRETRLVAAARKRGCDVVPGIEMLARQAAAQVSLWLGREIPLDRLRAEGEAALASRSPAVVLAGMRGVGKSTVGPLVARALDRPFTDLDDRIEARAGRSVPEIFHLEGEAGFRRRERIELRAAVESPGVVLALGGGTFQSARNRRILGGLAHRVVWLTAPVEVLAERIRASDRPSLTGVSPASEAEALLREREPTWRAVADVEVDAADGTPGEVAGRVLDALRSRG